MRGGLCYSRVDAGVSGPDKRRGHSVFTVGSFMALVKQEPVVEGGGGRGASVGRPLFVLSQASAIGQRARGGGWAAGVTDLTFVSVMGVEQRKGGGALE